MENDLFERVYLSKDGLIKQTNIMTILLILSVLMYVPPLIYFKNLSLVDMVVIIFIGLLLPILIYKEFWCIMDRYIDISLTKALNEDSYIELDNKRKNKWVKFKKIENLVEEELCMLKDINLENTIIENLTKEVKEGNKLNDFVLENLTLNELSLLKRNLQAQELKFSTQKNQKLTYSKTIKGLFDKESFDKELNELDNIIENHRDVINYINEHKQDNRYV